MLAWDSIAEREQSTGRGADPGRAVPGFPSAGRFRLYDAPSSACRHNGRGRPRAPVQNWIELPRSIWREGSARSFD
jgi:hypothetical protein